MRAFTRGPQLELLDPEPMKRLQIVAFLIISIVYAHCINAALELDRTQIQLKVVPGFDPFDSIVKVEVSGSDGVSLESDASWLSATFSDGTDEIFLSYDTGNLIKATNTATLSVTGGGETKDIFVTAKLEALNVVRLTNDPSRNRVLGLHRLGTEKGLLLVIDPDDGSGIGSIAVGERPSDVVISEDGREALVLNAFSSSISVVDMNRMEVVDTIGLPEYENWSGGEITTGDLSYGAGDLIYYSDGAWAPSLHVYDRSEEKLVQTLTEVGNGSYGFGDFVLSPDKSKLYSWSQYGWSAGSSGSSAAQYDVNSDGSLEFVKEESYDLQRDPLDAPAFVSANGEKVFLKQLSLDTQDIATIYKRYSGEVFSISLNGEFVGTRNKILEAETGIALLELPVETSVQVITQNYSRFVYFDSQNKELGVVDLMNEIDLSKFASGVSPANGAIVLAGIEFKWNEIPGSTTYRVYWGKSQSSVEEATIDSDEYQGETTDLFFDPIEDFDLDSSYYWRVDAIGLFGTQTGLVREFYTSSISIDQISISGQTILGHQNFLVSLDLQAGEGQSVSWTVDGDDDWIQFGAETGSTPSSLEVFLDASELAIGEHESAVRITPEGRSEIEIPVIFQVNALHLRQVETVPESAFAYAVSEDVSSAGEKAYLLEINTITQEISRVIEVGSSVTDVSVSRSEGKIYATNWRSGSLLAIDLERFEIVDTFGFEPGGGYYTDRDIYKISAGPEGRLIGEAQDQWVDVFLIDTEDGSVLTSTGLREGGGEYGPNGRYYYHGDNNSSGAELHKFDMIGDQFTSLTTKRVEDAGYYGSRTIVVSRDGSRVFWNGAVFDDDLDVLWSTKELVYSCSENGQLAFTEKGVYDTFAKTRLGNMPVETSVSGYSDVSGMLIVQKEGALHFEKIASQDSVRAPIDGAIALPTDSLFWSELSVATQYRVFFGEDEAAVEAAESDSKLLVGEVDTAGFVFDAPLPSGTFFWKVETITPFGNIVSEVYEFQIASIAPEESAIYVDAVEGYEDIEVPIVLAASSSDVVWTVDVSHDWMNSSIPGGTGETQFVLHIDASGIDFGTHEGIVTLSVESSAEEIEIPVSLNLEPLNLTVLKSDPTSEYAYGVSEFEEDGFSEAYLLKVDTLQERVVDSLYVGSSVTDIAVHSADGKVYVSNWRFGKVRVVDIDSFEIVNEFLMSVPSGSSSLAPDPYKLTSVGEDRLVIEGEDQWVSVALFDTDAGVVLKSLHMREGGGGAGVSSRYYYHGDNNSSGAALRKVDLFADEFSELASKRTDSNGYYGSRVVTVSEDGSRIFWNGAMFDEDLSILYEFQDLIYAANEDGSLAFGRDKIYDMTERAVILGMPNNSGVSAYNSTTQILVAQDGNRIGFFDLSDPSELVAPELDANDYADKWVMLTWSDRTLETGFSIQYRKQGSGDWIDVQDDVGANVGQFEIGNLEALTEYDFRVRAYGPESSSAWSNVLTLVTTDSPPPIPQGLNSYGQGAYEVRVEFSVYGTYDKALIERGDGSNPSDWEVIGEIDALQYVVFNDKDGLMPASHYSYRVRTVKGEDYSSYTYVSEAWTRELYAPSRPWLQSAVPLDDNQILVTWSGGVPDIESYDLQYRVDGEEDWVDLVSLNGEVSRYLHAGLQRDVTYEYRIQAVNAAGSSEYSESRNGTPRVWLDLVSEDFEDGIDPVLWSFKTEGIAAVEDHHNLDGGGALWVDLENWEDRLIRTMTLDLTNAEFIDFELRLTDQWLDEEPVPAEYSKFQYFVFGVQNENGVSEMIYRYGFDSVEFGDWTDFSFELPVAARTSQSRVFLSIRSNETNARLSMDNFRIRATELPDNPPSVAYVLLTAVNPNVVKVEWPMPIDEVRDSVDLMAFEIERKVEIAAWESVGIVHAGEEPEFVDAGVPSGSTVHYRVVSKLPWGESSASPASSVTLEGPLSNWRSVNFGESRSGDTSVDTEYDDFGIQNLSRYAFGLDVGEFPVHHSPGEVDYGLPVVFEDPEHGVCFEFPKRKDELFPEVEYIVQISVNGIDWYDAPKTEAELESVNGIWEIARYVLQETANEMSVDPTTILARVQLKWVE